MKRYYKYVCTTTYGTLHLTKNKIYDVIRYIPIENDNDGITIVADTGKVINLYIKVGDTIVFEDVTTEIRNNTIDEILC